MKRCQATCHIAIWPTWLLARDWIHMALMPTTKGVGSVLPPFKKLISICIFLHQLFTTIYICYCIIVYLDVRIDLWLRYIFGTWPKKCITFAKHSKIGYPCFKSPLLQHKHIHINISSLNCSEFTSTDVRRFYKSSYQTACQIWETYEMSASMAIAIQLIQKTTHQLYYRLLYIKS